ncbi:uncharacterized protein LOC144744639 [Ciona intestinalis]
MDQEALFDLIDNATDSFKVTWAQKKKGFEHTGIVLVLDDVPICTLDFGPPANIRVGPWDNSSWNEVKTPFAVVYFQMEIARKIIQGSIENNDLIKSGNLEVVSTTEENDELRTRFLSMVVSTLHWAYSNKVAAKEMIRNLLDMQLDRYHLVGNNCRSHVVAVYKMAQENWDFAFQESQLFQDMYNIARNDATKITKVSMGSMWVMAFTPIVGLAVAGLGYAVARGLGLKSDASVTYGKAIKGAIALPKVPVRRLNSISSSSTIIDGETVCSFGHNESIMLLQKQGAFKGYGSESGEIYMRYFQSVHKLDQGDASDIDVTYFFIPPTEIQASRENILEILHDMLMLEVAPRLARVPDKLIAQIFSDENVSDEILSEVKSVLVDFGQSVSEDSLILMFKSHNLIHFDNFTL